MCNYGAIAQTQLTIAFTLYTLATKTVRCTHQLSKTKTLQIVLDELDDLIKVQATDGNWNYDPYMRGMANGMLLAKSLLDGQDPEYIDSPEMYLRDIEMLDKFNQSSVVLKNDR